MVEKQTWKYIGIGVFVTVIIVAFIVTIVLLTRKKKEGFVSQPATQPPASTKAPVKVSTITDRAQTKPVLVLFWADWCGYSRSFKTVWDSQISGKIPGVLTDDRELKTVDTSKLRGLVTAFPTLIFYPKGFGLGGIYDPNAQAVKYEGIRTPEALKDFAEEHLSPPPSEVEFEPRYDDTIETIE